MALDIGKRIAELKQVTVRELREKYEAVFGEPTRFNAQTREGWARANHPTSGLSFACRRHWPSRRQFHPPDGPVTRRRSRARP